MADKHIYTTSLRWDEQRKGILSSEGLPDIEVATPPEFPKGHPGIWSPEHLFVASAEICLMTTFLAIAENSKLEFTSYSSSAEGVLEKTENGFMITEITLRPRIVIPHEDKRDRAIRIITKAEKVCLISNSMKTAVHLEPEIVVQP
ncbi:MAG: OsmC family peroxiredoxin [Gemmatimonadetes bacterium]|nr:MAG: OsmC family peroxiredoxin [Gemmatimonadota bacterium]